MAPTSPQTRRVRNVMSTEKSCSCRDSVLHSTASILILPPPALEDAYRKLTRPEGATLDARNRAFHQMLVDGVTVEYKDGDSIRGAQAQIVDFERPSNNDWLAVNQFTVVESKHERRPDIVLFVNGLPLGVVELKNPTNEDASIWIGWQQLQTYKAELPALFSMNAVLIVSDGIEARIGTLTAGWEWFKPWRTTSGEALADPSLPQLQVMLEGACLPARFLSLLRDFMVFEDDGGVLAKKMAGYHQFHAVETAVAETLRAAELQRSSETGEERGRYESGRRPGGEAGDRRIGVVWHTQGSGKSLTMAFYAGRIIREHAMENPTVVVLTDRNDLDDQLFGTFARCQDLLRQPPVQATSRADLRSKLAVESGGVVFTTIQKFFPGERGDRHPLLSSRRNIVVIADEAHRSQYDFIDGFARHNAGMRSPTHPSSASRGHRSNFRTPTPERCSGTTSASTTSSAQCRTGPRCRSTTRAAWPNWHWTRANGRKSTPTSRRPPKAKRSTARRSSRANGHNRRQSSALKSVCVLLPRTSSRTSKSG